MSNREYQIRYLAYQIWEREGRPHGREAEHWDQAIRELDAPAATPAGAPNVTTIAGSDQTPRRPPAESTRSARRR